MLEILSRPEARAKGLRHFNTGRPCRRGHNVPRLVSSGTCPLCEKETKKGRRSTINAEARLWYARNREQRLRTNQHWCLNHPEKAQANYRLKSARRRARQLHATLPGYEDELRAIYNARQEGEEIDHIVPLVNDRVCGLHVPWNLQRLVKDANRKKSNRFDPDDPLQGSCAFS